jgi:hypothetical protein
VCGACLACILSVVYFVSADSALASGIPVTAVHEKQ